MLLYGFSLNPDVHYLKLGVVDYANTYESRELVAELTENKVFVVEKYMFNDHDLGEQVRQGKITAGLVIPYDFNRHLSEDKPAEIQILVDAVDANTAGIAQGYLNQIIYQFNQRFSSSTR